MLSKMVLGLGNKGLFTKPEQYASPRKHSGPPATVGDAQRDAKKSYDYVIVGGGTAGCVLASRLTEDPNVSVLVLEAGGDNRKVLETKVPLTFSKLFHTDNDWNYYTTPQENVGKRELYWPRGRIIGGSSSINAMMSHQGDAADFDQWASEYGCTGWSYKDVLPYMRKSERFTPNPNRPAIDLQHRGDTGPWQTGYSWLSEIGEKGFIEGCQEVGIPYSSDINTSKGTLGVTRFQTFIDSKGQRSSAATAYLPQSVLNRPNLDVAVNVRVQKVIFDHIFTKDGKPTAIGVEIATKKDGPVFDVHAKREVLLCGGSINTPQLLMLSGIGPRNELQKQNIPVIQELAAVGQNLKDHFCTSSILAKARCGTTLDYLGSDIAALPSLARWLLTGGGPLTSNVGEAACFLRSTHPPCQVPGVKPFDNTSGGKGPDIEVIGAPLCYLHHGEHPAPPNTDCYSMVPIGLKPQSKGYVGLKTASAWDHPIIDPRYWTDENDNDRKVLIVGVRICLKILQSPSMKKFLEPVEPNDDPTSFFWPYSSSNYDAITDEQLLTWMKGSAFTLYHPVGTARMGTDVNTSVIDLQCKVHGINGLRVIDASVMPEQISGHPTASIIAIAEKMSDVIVGKSSINGDATRTAPLKGNGAPLPQEASRL